MSPQQVRLPDDIYDLVPNRIEAAPTDASGEIPATQLFGMPLDVVMGYPMNLDRDMPVIVSDAIDCLQKNGVTVQGIFRVSGSRGRVLQILKIYNSGSQVDFFKEDIHDVAGVLKQYIRELPDPLCCAALYPEWLQAIQSDPSETVASLKVLVDQLPLLHKNILQKLFHLLSVIASNSDKTSMNVMNLAIVWSPNILKNPTDSLEAALRDTPLTNQVVTSLIQNYSTFFPSGL
eukprot:TRINITY_DN1394_c0_g1_i1.p1 TRINITY_DN1394_c0_g1~~TRINITY_DN1394_c0_g1_i1.p1  ORF type:complete len:233 (+),score=18.84 TRINITY_DN1394_c0_g1_i1:164-862(+)